MSKRGASVQITKDDYDEGGEDCSDHEEKLKQGFNRASSDVLSKRKIYKVKQRFVAPKSAKTEATNGTTPTAVSSPEKPATSNSFASTTLAQTENGSSNPFASTVLASSPGDRSGADATGTKKVFGFGSASGFGPATSGSSSSGGSASFGGGFAGVGTNGKSSGFGSSSTSSSSSKPGSTSGFVFGSSSSSSSLSAGSGSTKSLFGNPGASTIKFSLSKTSPNGNDSTDPKATDTSTEILPDKVDLKTGEEDEEAIHSGRCKSYEWVLDDKINGADGSDMNSDKLSSNKNKANLSVKSSTQFQAAITSSKPSNGTSDDNDQSDDAKRTTDNGEGANSASATTPQNGSSVDAAACNSTTATAKHRWVELGIGPVKILRSKSKPERLRVVQRRESSKMGPATKVILNIPLWRESTCERDRQAQQYLRLKTMKDGKMCQYSLKFKENADAGYFHHHLADYIPLARQCFDKTAGLADDK